MVTNPHVLSCQVIIYKSIFHLVIPLKYDELSPLRMQWAHSYWYPLGDYGVKGKPI